MNGFDFGELRGEEQWKSIQGTSPPSGTGHQRMFGHQRTLVGGRPSAAFRFDRVCKRFGGELLLDDLNWEGPAGSVIALLGRNGAGKTTSLRILLGLERPDAGRTEVLGLDSRSQGLEIRRKVGFLAEQPALYDWMTVAEIGWFTAGFYPLGFLEEFARLIGEFRVPERRRIKDLCRGERAKVALALAMAHRPELLVLDEPTTGLDPLVCREFLEAMTDVATSGRTVLLSSHQIQEVERVADVVAILRRGRLVAVGPLDDLKFRVREVTVAWRDPVSAPPCMGGSLLDSERNGRQWRLLIRDLDDARLASLLNDPRVRQLDVRRPALEEIFTGLVGGHDAVTAYSADAKESVGRTDIDVLCTEQSVCRR